MSSLDEDGIALKPKLTFGEMINHLERKNIKFNLIDKNEAEEMLRSSNYFYKITAYRKNFEKNKHGKYINLEFKLLRDLSTIDMRLRYTVLQMCLDIEHTLKTKLLAEITDDENEDGYEIVRDFFTWANIDVEKLIRPLTNQSHYNYGLYVKYQNNWPIWVVLEIIMFSDFVKFIEFYYDRKNKPDSYSDLQKVLKYVKNIRNIAAHNSPILIDITHKNQIMAHKVSQPITTFTKRITGMLPGPRKNRLSNRKIHDLTALLFVYDKYIKSAEMKRTRYEALVSLLERAKRDRNDYVNQDGLIAVYKYFKKIIDFVR